MPTGAGYAEGVEYFRSDAFASDGAWNTGITTTVQNFYKKVFGNSLAPTNVNSMYNLYGDLMISGNDKGKFHQGVDIYKSDGAAIKNVHSGTVTVTAPAAGQVAFKTYTFKPLYLHLDMGSQVTTGTNVVVGDTLCT